MQREICMSGKVQSSRAGDPVMPIGSPCMDGPEYKDRKNPCQRAGVFAFVGL